MLKEQLELWINNGFNDQAVAVYGTSVEKVAEILKSGKLIDYGSSGEEILEYQRKIFRKGSLYYVFPLLERMKLFRPRVVTEIQEKFPKQLSEEEMIGFAKKYALEHALEDCFLQKVGSRYRTQEIILMAGLIFPKLLSEVLEDPRFESQELAVYARDIYDKHHEGIFKGLEGLNLTFIDLELALTKSLKRRGVLIYFGEELARNRQNKFLPGREMDEEMMVVSRSPLKISVISGISFESNEDQNALMDNIK